MKPDPTPRRAAPKAERRPIGAALIELAAHPHKQPGPAVPGTRKPAGRQIIEQALLVNAITASDTGGALDTALAHAINTANTTIYDKAIDSAYLSTGVGGSRLHHLLDGQHDLLGAFRAAQAASPTDSLGSEIFGTAEHLAKDLFSKMGLPVFSLEPDTYHQSANWIQQHLGISKSWQSDLLQINGMELLGGSLSAAAVVMGARRKDVGALAETAVSSGLAGVLAANPIAMCAGSIALALACRHCAEPSHRKVALQRAGAAGAGTVTTMAVGKVLGGVAAAGTFPLIGSLALSLTAGLLLRTWLLRRMQQSETETEPVPVNKAESKAMQRWQGQIEFQALQVRDHLDAAALEVLRKAFKPATAMHPIRLLTR